MALRFLDSGGQHYVNAQSGATQYLLLRKWTVTDSEVANNGSGRRGQPYIGNQGAMKTLTQTSNWICGAAMQLSGGTQCSLHAIQNGGAQVANLELNADFTISVQVAGGNIFTSTLSVTDATTWHFYEVQWILSGTGTQHGTVVGTLWVDGDLWGTWSGTSGATGSDFINGSFTANQVGFLSGCNVMDYYALDTSSTDINGNPTTNTARLGDVQVTALFPATDVTTNWSQFGGTSGTANSAVSDLVSTAEGTFSSPDDDTSYVYSSSTGQSESFNYQSISTFTGTIFGAQYSVCAKKTAEGSREIALVVGTTTVNTENFLGTANYLSDYYVYYIAPLDSNPIGTGTPWTIAGYDAQTFGVTLIG